MALLDLLLGSHLQGPGVGMLPPYIPELNPIDEGAEADRARAAAARRLGARRAPPEAAPLGMPPLPEEARPGVASFDAAVPFAAVPPGFDALDAGPAPDPAAAVQEATEAAAGRMRRSVQRPSRWPNQAPIPGIEAVAGLLSGQTGAGFSGAQSVDESGFQMPPSTNDPESREPQVLADGVPLPRPKPQMPTDVSGSRTGGQPSAPLSLAPQMGGEGGGLGGMLGGLFKPENAPLLLALGAGLAGAPSFGTGLRRAASNATPVSLVMQKQRQADINQRQTYAALISRGVPPQEAMAAVRSPEILKSVLERYSPGKPTEVKGRLVQTMPDGSVKVLADFSEDDGKNPIVQEFKLPDRSTVKRQFNRKTGQWDDIAGFEKPAPPDIRETKLEEGMAGRLGLAKSFLGQLPGIRKKVAEGKVTGAWDAAKAMAGVGEPGEIRRQIDSGSDALIRMLTGAGMAIAEASDYARRYRVVPIDTADTVISKLDQLERELTTIAEVAGKGRGGSVLAPKSSGKTTTGLEWSVD